MRVLAKPFQFIVVTLSKLSSRPFKLFLVDISRSFLSSCVELKAQAQTHTLFRKASISTSNCEGWEEEQYPEETQQWAANACGRYFPNLWHQATQTTCETSQQSRWCSAVMRHISQNQVFQQISLVLEQSLAQTNLSAKSYRGIFWAPNPLIKTPWAYKPKIIGSI